ncbi:MAG: xylulokinase [Burkholderiales bacterium]|nr:xylulokinase [Burkholderiales bacterium]
MYLGIDLGTSGVKAVVVDDAGAVVAHALAPLTRQSPRPGWSEQDPAHWWRATAAAVRELPTSAREGIRAIGLAGQMHGAVLLDRNDRVLRPAILWNDGRAAAACRMFEAREPASRTLSGNLAMPGFTAPKLVWTAAHEPGVFARTARVLLPKDWLRLELTGEHASEPSDASGTLWLDLATRQWSPPLLAASGLTEAAMPRLVESAATSGSLTAHAASALGLAAGIPVVGGGSDNACGAAGIGVIDDGQALLSLGTSGVLLVADDRPRPDPARAVHAFCHCLPERWLRLAVTLSCTATLGAVVRLTGAADEASLVAEVEAAATPHPRRLVVLPYLDGERTPHNDPAACGVVFGLDATTTRADLGRAALEGVAFAFADGLDALEATGSRVASLAVVGGGSRSRAWGRLIAAALQRPLAYPRGGDVGPALGAAGLARVGAGVPAREAFAARGVTHVIEPESSLTDELAARRAIFRSLYRDLAERFALTMPGSEVREPPLSAVA